jgi:signal transduction histidine kinase
LSIRLSIPQKILAVFLVPFIFEVAFFWFLYRMNQSTASIAAAERRQSEIVEHLNGLAVLIGNSMGYAFYRDRWQRGEQSRTAADLQAEYDRLVRLTSDNPDLFPKILAIGPVVNQQIKNLKTIRSLPYGALTTSALDSIQFRDAIQSMAANTDSVTSALKEQQEVLNLNRQRHAATQELLRRIMFLGVLVNVAIALVMVTLFMFDFKRRFARLLGNAHNLTTEQPLAIVSGGDELTALNKVLVEAAGRLDHAKRRRQHIMQMIAHDLRSPLMASQISLDLLLRRLGETFSENASRQLNAIKRNTDRMLRLTEDLLVLEKLESGTLSFDPEVLNLKEVTGFCIDGIKEIAEQNGVHIDNECKTVSVNTDRKRFEQIMMNLLSNAIKFSPRKSVVTIKSLSRSDSVEVSVLDNGPGLEKRELENIFERYYQVKNTREFEGFGIGLAIVKALVEGQGGTVGVESVSGKGSRFWFTLPHAHPAMNKVTLVDIDAAAVAKESNQVS